MKRCLVPVVAIFSFFQAAEASEIGVSAGYLKPFLDETGGLTGSVTMSMPLTRRLAIRPELIYGTIAGYRRIFVLGNVTFDITNPKSPAVLYFVGGAGLTNTLAKSISYSYSEVTELGGAGIRYSLGQRWTGTVEFRIGLDSFPIVTGGLAYRFGGKGTR